MNPTVRQILFVRSNQEGMDGAGRVACVGYKRNVYVVLVGKAGGKSPLGRSGRTWKDDIKCVLKKLSGWACIGLMWLRIRTGGGLL